jgi:hypothetical protein
MDLLNFTTNIRSSSSAATASNNGDSTNQQQQMSSLSSTTSSVTTTSITSSSSTSASSEDQTLKECESYVNKHNVKELLKDCIVQLCLKKPDNPISFLRQHFEKLDKVSQQPTSYFLLFTSEL